MDKNRDGFLSIDEWSQGIEQYLLLSNEAKAGFFAFMDKSHNGMINKQQFIQQLKQNLEKNKKQLQQDNFNIQVDIIKKLQKWVEKNSLSAEDAFRAVDNDFDGFINKKDLEHFLLNVLHLSEKVVTSPVIDRLFKLMDQFKRGCIQVNDFKKVLEHNVNTGMNLTISGFKNLTGRSTFDWKINARQ